MKKFDMSKLDISDAVIIEENGLTEAENTVKTCAIGSIGTSWGIMTALVTGAKFTQALLPVLAGAADGGISFASGMYAANKTARGLDKYFPRLPTKTRMAASILAGACVTTGVGTVAVPTALGLMTKNFSGQEKTAPAPTPGFQAQNSVNFADYMKPSL